MQKLLLLALLFIGSSLEAQEPFFDLISKNEISVLNTNNTSLRIIVYSGLSKKYDAVLRPGEVDVIKHAYNKSAVSNLNYIGLYDFQALQLDNLRAKNTIEYREEERKRKAFWNSIFSAADQYFFDGNVTKAFQVLKTGKLLLDGASSDELADQAIALGKLYITEKAVEATDGDVAKAIVAGSFDLVELAYEKEYEDIVEFQRYCLNKLNNYKITGKITDTAKFPKRQKMDYPKLVLDGSYPFRVGFGEYGKEDDRFFTSDEINNDTRLPIELGINIYGKNGMGYFLDYAKTNHLVNISQEESQYFKANEGVNFETYSAGIRPSFSWLELGLGMAYIQNVFSQFDGSEVSTTLREVDKFGVHVEPRANISLGDSFALFGSYKLILFDESAIDRNILMLHSLKAGIRIRLKLKSYLDFSG